ncbi:hypothetical protein L3Q82_012097 [Scortum barcoo]|uniref:Uncharacterized protein n=1 Tax=Scortum barcoo TaxID=214431 RepID=A0ACB8W768_9TELE|nr:hypothetical protein L3Q82_012097 [Scortum barcoo]
MEVGDSASGVANLGWWSLFLKRGTGECVPTTGDHTSQPPREGLRQGTERVLEGLWEFAQPVHMCFVDLEKAFDRVPRGILWGVLRMRFLSVASQGPEGVRFGNHRISSLLFADDVVLMASSGQDLQHVLERFAAECEAAGMRISTSKSEAMVLDRPEKGGMPSPGWVERSCLKWRSSSISGSCSRVRERSEREIDRRDWCSVRSYARRCTGPSW